MYDKLLQLAKAPKDNPASLGELCGFERYLLTPIDHDYPGKTSAMWNAAHRAFGLDARMAMVVGEAAHGQEIFDAFRADAKYIGGGVGAGFKELATKCVDELTPLARAMGAVNIIKKTPHGSLVGDNTDGVGFAKSLEKMLGVQGKQLSGARVLLLGSGGTARAIAFALAHDGARLTILNRTVQKALDLAQEVNAYSGTKVAEGGGRERIAEVLSEHDAVVSTIDDAMSPLDVYSPLGEMELPVTPESVAHNLAQSEALLQKVSRGFVVSDIRLRNELPVLLSQANKLKLPTLNGNPMVVNQGIVAFWWLWGDVLAQKGFEQEDVADVMWRTVDLH